MQFEIDCYVVYLQDNDSAITLACSGTHAYDRKRKAMTSCINDIHDYIVGDGKVSIMSTSTLDMNADILTKALFSHSFSKHRSTIFGLCRSSYDEALGGVWIKLGLQGQFAGTSTGVPTGDKSSVKLPIRIPRLVEKSDPTELNELNG